MKSFYRNWHRPASWHRTKPKNLSDVFGIEVTKEANTLTAIHFMEEYGDRITFSLQEADAKFLLTQLQKRFNHE